MLGMAEGTEHLQRIATTNRKGGSGKTTTAAHLVRYLALQGDRVLAVDLDPPLADRKSADRMVVARVAQALATVEDRYDVVVIDCPPQLGFLTPGGLCAATPWLTTVHPQMLDVMSMCRFLAMTSDQARRTAETSTRERAFASIDLNTEAFMPSLRHRSRRVLPIFAACALALPLIGSPALAQSTVPSTMKPKPDASMKPNTGAESTTGVGNSPIVGSGETGNGRVLTGTGGSGTSPLPGTRDPSSTTGPGGAGGTAADPISPKSP